MMIADEIPQVCQIIVERFFAYRDVGTSRSAGMRVSDASANDAGTGSRNLSAPTAGKIKIMVVAVQRSTVYHQKAVWKTGSHPG
jgi:hypothetical protein